MSPNSHRWYDPSSWRRLDRARLAAAAIALILAFVFILENDERVRIHFVVFTVSSRMWIGFLISLVLGGLLGQVAGPWRRRRGRGR